jgi:LPXTG-motif cell wall-anchored protein
MHAGSGTIGVRQVYNVWTTRNGGIMRRTLLLATVAAALLLAAPGPALAKGENGTVTITGPGLAGPIVLRHDDSVLWFDEGGTFETKWPGPVIGGSVRPNAHLGLRFDVIARFGPECPGVVHQVLYPYAPEGPQIRTIPGQHICGPLPGGYWPAPQSILDMLVAHGLAATPTVGTTTRTVTALAVAPTTGSGATAVVLGLTAVLAAAAAFLALRRRRRPAP